MWKPRFAGDDPDALSRHVAFLSKAAGVNQSVAGICSRLGYIEPEESVYLLEDQIYHLRSSEKRFYGVLGGIVAAQVLNIITMRFRPANQWVSTVLIITHQLGGVVI